MLRKAHIVSKDNLSEAPDWIASVLDEEKVSRKVPSIYAAFGIPDIAVAMVIGIEPILDMFGTAQSVVGNITSSFVACRKENLVAEKT